MYLCYRDSWGGVETIVSEAGTRYMMGLYIRDHSSEDINGSTITPQNYSASTKPTKE